MFATTIFSATQSCNIVATLFRMVTTLLQHCNAVLRLKSSLRNRIVQCNITLSDSERQRRGDRKTGLIAYFPCLLGYNREYRRMS